MTFLKLPELRALQVARFLSYCDDMSANMRAIANELFGGPSFRLGAEPLQSSLQG